MFNPSYQFIAGHRKVYYLNYEQSKTENILKNGAFHQTLKIYLAYDSIIKTESYKVKQHM